MMRTQTESVADQQALACLVEREARDGLVALEIVGRDVQLECLVRVEHEYEAARGADDNERGHGQRRRPTRVRAVDGGEQLLGDLLELDLFARVAVATGAADAAAVRRLGRREDGQEIDAKALLVLCRPQRCAPRQRI